ncbi:MAG TPA: prepilin peptidase [Acidimicrobiales bacterium]|nr:prepilin peptidase [Acidimicrobiales bacterium]
MLVPAGLLAALMLGAWGLLMGSFANVLIYRLPAGRSIVTPGSACPACGTHIRPIDNIPLVSWLVLGGHCRRCRAPISPRYPAVEALVGLIFAAIGWRFGISWTGLGEAMLAAGLVALAFIDFDHMILPKRLVYATLVAVLVAFALGTATTGEWHRLAVAAICAVVPWTVFFAINFVSPKALGFGDVRLALLIGFGLGWLGAAYAFLGFIVASVLGAVVGVALMATGKATRRTKVPFGTFLACGAILAALAGSPVVNWYLGQIHA